MHPACACRALRSPWEERGATPAELQDTWNKLVKAARNNNMADLPKLAGYLPLMRRKLQSRCVTPLHIAARGYHPKAVTLLLDNYHVVAPMNELGRTPLHEAVASGKKAMVDLLLQRGHPVAVADDNGVTPLHLAVANTNTKLTRMLLEWGAPVEPPNSLPGCKTPLQLAESGRDVEMLKMMRAYARMQSLGIFGDGTAGGPAGATQGGHQVDQ